MDVYEVFRRTGHKDPFEHCGAVIAPDPEMGLLMAKECFLRRREGRASVARAADGHPFLQRREPARDRSGQELSLRATPTGTW